jgi:hypothetical protein
MIAHGIPMLRSHCLPALEKKISMLLRKARQDIFVFSNFLGRVNLNLKFSMVQNYLYLSPLVPI